MTLAMDIGSFMAPDRFARLVSDHADCIRGSCRAEGAERIYLPGEIESEREGTSRAEGVEMDRPAIETLNGLLDKFNIQMARLRDKP